MRAFVAFVVFSLLALPSLAASWSGKTVVAFLTPPAGQEAATRLAENKLYEALVKCGAQPLDESSRAMLQEDAEVRALITSGSPMAARDAGKKYGIDVILRGSLLLGSHLAQAGGIYQGFATLSVVAVETSSAKLIGNYTSGQMSSLGGSAPAPLGEVPAVAERKAVETAVDDVISSLCNRQRTHTVQDTLGVRARRVGDFSVRGRTVNVVGLSEKDSLLLIGSGNSLQAHGISSRGVGAPVWTATASGEITALHVSPIAGIAVMGTSSGELIACRLGDGGIARRLAAGVGAISSVHSAGTLIAAGGTGGVAVFDGPTGRAEMSQRTKKKKDRVEAVVLDPGGRTVTWIGHGGAVTIWDLTRNRAVVSRSQLSSKDIHEVRLAALSSDGRVLAIAGIYNDVTFRHTGMGGMGMRGGGFTDTSGLRQEERILLLDASSLRRIKLLQAPHFEPVRGLAFGSSQRYLVSGGEDDVIALWDAQTEEEGSRPMLKVGQVGTIHGVAADGGWMAAVGTAGDGSGPHAWLWQYGGGQW